jgi:hypothetical protein
MAPEMGKEQELLPKSTALIAKKDRASVNMATLADNSQHRKDWMLLQSGKLELAKYVDVRRRK